MIVKIVQTLKVNGRWFLEGTEYLHYLTYQGPNPDCLYNDINYGKLSGAYYKVLIEDVFYDIPDVCAALLPGEDPSEDMSPRMQRLYAQRTKDWTAPMFGGHTDVVKQAKKFLGLNIAKKQANNVDVDQRKISMLNELRRSKGLDNKKSIGINETSTTDQTNSNGT